MLMQTSPGDATYHSLETVTAGDEITLVAGDADYVPAIKKLQRSRLRVSRRVLGSRIKGTEGSGKQVHLSQRLP